ncbi:MAG: benzoate-CoA ligase family protein [Burkholderiales bacterium]|nr:benzoate-CoA ligase family protein [Burkholderiales bacterium]
MLATQTENAKLGALGIEFPQPYNAAVDLVERNLRAGRADKIAVLDDQGSYTYAQVADRVNRFAGALTALGVCTEQRILLCLHDSIDFPTAFLGAIKAGIVPIPVNTLLTSKDYDFMLRDSRVQVLVVSEALVDTLKPILSGQPYLKHVIVSGEKSGEYLLLSDLTAAASPDFDTAPTSSNDACFWLYSSGSTGSPKGTVHLHSSLIYSAETYAKLVLGIQESDLVYSAAKLFFAYGLGNGLTFPFSVGATTILTAERPTPASVSRILRQRKPSIFYGVPTLYGALLSSPDMPSPDELSLRRCTSAGEALPPDIGRRWTDATGIDILDGIGSTEMLHIFLSNRPGDVRYGTTGKPVPGYQVKIVDENNVEVAVGEIGELQVLGPTAATCYWNNPEKSCNTFLGQWTRCGDKYVQSEDGYFTYCGRSDDMLKVGGIYVSPIEVEASLCSHESVQEVAIVGQADADDLIKPKAYVVLRPGLEPSPELAVALQLHVKNQIAPFKYPRWIEFIAELPKTATGKIQRFKLRSTPPDAESATNKP